ncbi:thymidine kinase 2, mitochondrial-like isoform X2 [Xenia sp. Carnegie-2017]|uniref:thymidine kinase 2, mitochondrial-like isoform X2 n=1 Tax=Xenia sp. Carnegie-2017 TaxID=2897299 RepID=UPI001F043968|nr:thymidine kinase 2, mitochondrial-like isoform X2 [Xenia sp. Carnegie-2017]
MQTFWREILKVVGPINRNLLLQFTIKTKNVFKMIGNGKTSVTNKWIDETTGKNIKPVRISIEGNIGSGKTTLLEYFKRHSHVEVFTEPVNKWQNIGDGNALGLVYEDPSRWSFLFQSYVLLTMLEVHKTKQDHPVTLMERSIYSASYCFVENLYQSGKMSSVEYNVYQKWFNYIMKEDKPKLDLIVYLRTSPEECYKRLKKRRRKEEIDIPMSLLETIDQHHEDWLINKTKFDIPAPVLVLDGNKDLKDMFKIYETNTNSILLGMGDEPITCRD